MGNDFGTSPLLNPSPLGEGLFSESTTKIIYYQICLSGIFCLLDEKVKFVLRLSLSQLIGLLFRVHYP
jgi:hypothetical protein